MLDSSYNISTNTSPLSGFSRETYDSREAWLLGRGSILGSTGASDAAARMGLSPWETIDDLYSRSIGLKPPKDLSNNAAVQFGVEAEEHIRRLVALDLMTTYKVENHPFDILRMNAKPWIFATLDGELMRYSDYLKGGLEIKTGSFRNEKDLEDWKNGMPLHYYAQVCQQLLVTGWQYWIVVARLKRTPFKEDAANVLPEIRCFYRYVDAADKDVQESMHAIEENADMFHDCVINRRRPSTTINYKSRR